MLHVQPLHQLPTSRIILFLLICLTMVLSWTQWLDGFAIDYIGSSLTQAGTAFASARLINAVVSMLQTTTIGALSNTITIGELLDPLNDMVENFSTVMKWSFASLLLQKMLLQIIATDLFNWLLTISGIGSLLALQQSTAATNKFNWIIKAFITCLALRFLVLLMVLLNSAFSYFYLDDNIEQNLLQLKASEQQIQQLNQQAQSQTGISQPTATTHEQQAQLQQLKQQQNQLKQRLQELAQQIEQIQIGIKQLKQNLPWYQSNPLVSPELKAQYQLLDNAQAAQQAIQQQWRNNLLQQRQLNTPLDAGQQAESGLYDELKSHLSQLKQSFSQWGSSISFSELQLFSSQAIDVMLQTLVSFIVKAILMPLLFLWLLLRLVKGVWGNT